MKPCTFHSSISLEDRKFFASLSEYQGIYRLYESTLKKLKNLSENEQQMAHRLDLIQFQLDEIQSAQLKLNEDEDLIEEKRKLSNYERIFDSVQSGYNALQGEQKGLDWIGMVMGYMNDAAELDPSYKEIAENVANSFYLLEDAASSLRNEMDFMEYDPHRLNEIETRLNEINGLKENMEKQSMKCWNTQRKIEEEIETPQNKETHIDKLQKKLPPLKKT